MNTVRFDDLELKPQILRGIKQMGFEEASPIQAKAIPIALSGKDLVGQAQTGTGKTAAFGIPILQKVDPSLKKVQRRASTSCSGGWVWSLSTTMRIFAS